MRGSGREPQAVRRISDAVQQVCSDTVHAVLECGHHLGPRILPVVGRVAAASPETRASETAQRVWPDTEVLSWSLATVQGEQPYNLWAAGRQPAHIQLRATRAECSGGASLTPGMLSWSMAQAAVLLSARSGADMCLQSRLLPGGSSRHPAAPQGILRRRARRAPRFLLTLDARDKPVPMGGHDRQQRMLGHWCLQRLSRTLQLCGHTGI